MWLDILNEIFNVCVVPLLGVATTALVLFIKQKIAEGQAKISNETASKYLGFLEQIVVDCVQATNQTYVNSLKDKNAFDADAQKQALALTTQAVMNILSQDAKNHLSTFSGDLTTLITEKIESTIAQNK